ncbi:NADH-quinone oxidoreductase subunit D-related protein [Parasporobacterium paucivorans]|uniref:Ni,Fe-hydrogenase III large subunit n=1 Tax=Parasporobacterium paucivorans DSM 15970 TaxID=1122934 RepID=A0A1M6FCP0_9FIRM|nr:NADH-quinone oxidoreductase subunit C [Parasporobacterium paucivorans]SHI95431.1 Ni,Fe-hydrogenase III large subunit [Parasporobacterium paucivorans DSM 15970]
MRLQEIKDAILAGNPGLNTEIKNKNELFVYADKDNIIKITECMFRDFRMYFAGEFCMQEDMFVISVILTSRKQGYFVIIRYETEGELISLQGLANQSGLFEREIRDLFGLEIVGAIDNRHLVKHEEWEKDVYPLCKDFTYGRKIRNLNETEVYRFKEVTNGGGYQIPVGPVHAGIIEPGHFRFSAIGEPIENLEIRLMYKHRGIEKICENTDINRLNLILERVSGESSVAYAEAYALLIEKILDYNLPEDIKAVRVVLLELERTYNYLDDIGGICLDVGFSYPAKKFAYLSEMIHQLCERITGSRFLRNVIVPCGLNSKITLANKADILETLQMVEKRFDGLLDITLNAVSFLDRVEDTGIVENKIAKSLNMTGVVARASDIHYDVRKSFPYEIYQSLKKEINFEKTGGAFERYKIKIAEIKDAFLFIRQALNLVENDVNKCREKINIEPGVEGFSIVETVKGELIVYGKTGLNNRFERLYMRTPSFMNWEGLTFAVLGEIVPDFPLCNKSFNMSYSENDR